MVIANGFITPTIPEALTEVKQRCDGHEVRTTPLPTVATMTYWMSDKGDVFGCQRLKSMCVTKPIRIESRYKKGCNIRYSTGGGQSNAFMQNLMYATFVSGLWDADMEFTFKDGNPYNYQLTNIEPRKPDISPVLMPNLETLQSVYASCHNEVAWYIRKYWTDISLDDCKDIASDAFYYLCSFRSYSPDYFVGIWKQTAVHRAQDWYQRYMRCCEGLYSEEGEERFGHTDKEVEVADIWGFVRGEKRKQYLRLWSEGETNVEIAERTGSSASTVGSEICRAVKELRTIYNKDIAVW